MESEEASEYALPTLDFEDALCASLGVPGDSSVSVWGVGEVSRQVVTPSRTHHGVPPQDVAGLSAEGPGQEASGCPYPADVGLLGHVAPESVSALGGGLGQVASTPPPPSPAWLPFLHLVFGPGGQQRGAGLPPLAMRRQHTLSHG